MPCFKAIQNGIREECTAMEGSGLPGTKKITLIIYNVAVDEIKPIMDFIKERRGWLAANNGHVEGF